MSTPAENALTDAAEHAMKAWEITREYVGEESLPALDGWAWFDSMRVLSAALAVPLSSDEAAAEGRAFCPGCNGGPNRETHSLFCPEIENTKLRESLQALVDEVGAMNNCPFCGRLQGHTDECGIRLAEDAMAAPA